MSTSLSETRPARAIAVKLTKTSLVVDLDDGRTVMVPIGWYPRLAHGKPAERNRWRLIARGEGIHWPDLDEDISVEGLLAGHPSGESQSSFQRWLAVRQRPRARGRIPRTRAASRAHVRGRATRRSPRR